VHAGNATELQYDINETKRDLDISWLIICGAMVFFMQAGFAMLEAGIVQPKNMANILFKNMVDCSIAAICFWLVGFGFAYGTDTTGFIGRSLFVTTHIYNGAGVGSGPYAPANDSDGWEKWFFQWAFSGACATIVAGSVAERCRTEAYFMYSIVLTSVIYPVVVHWGWGAGWLSAWGAFPDENGNFRPLFRYTEASNGMIDFAGSGIVHMVGGFAGLMGAVVVGPRIGRFMPDGTCVEFTQGNKALQALGTFILWFGWYGFNCGSTLKLSGGSAQVAAKVAFTTTISPSCACLITVIYSKLFLNRYDISLSLNGILAGLVSITAG
jgi:Amt family ammonium transporter